MFYFQRISVHTDSLKNKTPKNMTFMMIWDNSNSANRIRVILLSYSSIRIFDNIHYKFSFNKGTAVTWNSQAMKVFVSAVANDRRAAVNMTIPPHNAVFVRLYSGAHWRLFPAWRQHDVALCMSRKPITHFRIHSHGLWLTFCIM